MTKLEAARKARGWSQTTLAYRAKMVQADVSAIEHGRKPWPAHAERLGKVLGLRPEELVEDASGNAA